MELINSFYLNFYSVAMLSSAFLCLLAGTFLFLIPDKSKTTVHLGLSVIFGGLFSLGYFLSQGSYHSYPIIRPMLLIFILIHQIHTVQFILRFPDHNKPKFTRKFHFGHYIISIPFILALFYTGITGDQTYDFNGHYYEMNNPNLLKYYSVLALINAILITGFLIWKVKITKTGERGALMVILASLFLAEIGGATLNVLNKLGFIDRAGFISFFANLTILGYFGVLVAYINKTKDKTTFMFKVVGASFVTFILVFSIMAFMVYRDIENKYDIIKNSQARVILNEKEVIEGLEYIAVYDPTKDSFRLNPITTNVSLDNTIKRRMYLSWLHSKLSKTDNPNEVFNQMDNDKGSVYAKGYEYLIQSYPELPSPLDAYLKNKRQLFFKSNKIKELSNNNFRDNLIGFLAKEKGDIVYFKKAILDHLEKSTSEGFTLKQEVLMFLLPLQSPQERTYREDSSGNHFIAYHIVKPNENLVYEVGFSYRDYRLYAHQTGLTLLYVLLIGVFLIVIGTPIFLSGTLINPLQTLLEGLRKVRKGQLEIEIPVKVNDEIGFLTASFNNMVSSIRESKKKLEEYADQLEEKVEERTKELQFSLAQVEFLKTQQDGDYFLTTLLLRPLGVKNVNSENLKVEFFVKQKKEFNFKTGRHEIGGDICISQDILLRNKKYISFLNADAMGKSIQGAGGILVLGAVFQSIIQRTVNYKSHSEMAPEQWIKAAFKEMHKIFESFDGSMLISLVFGVVDDETGLVYYINAEHPWVILYRDNKACFIEDDMKFRKLGTAGVRNDFFVSMFQMEPGDILIMGSDGKDDLVMQAKTDDTNRIINEDESLILNRIEEANGDVNMIFKTIKSQYELMDDFSLLSLRYKEAKVIEQNDYIKTIDIESLILEARKFSIKGDYQSSLQILEDAYQTKVKRGMVVPYLVRLYMKLKKYQEASSVCKDYLSINEVDTSFMLRASYTLKMNREFEEAIDLAERVKLREPNNTKNLIHLADLYAVVGKFERASKLLKKASTLDPDNKKIPMLQEVIEKKVSISQQPALV
jgi:HAMP domain-containing protein/serine phosphatase RsbU (regulator of sigma subunit)